MAFEPTDQPYDAWAKAYRDWWAPVIAPSALRLLDRLAGAGLDRRASQLLDVGTGTGALAIAALERWPLATAIGVDPASRMLELAADEAERRGVRDRLRLSIPTWVTSVGNRVAAPICSAASWSSEMLFLNAPLPG